MGEKICGDRVALREGLVRAGQDRTSREKMLGFSVSSRKKSDVTIAAFC